jgi:hypothetical protein
MQHVYQLLLPSRTKAAYCPHFGQVLVETGGRSWRGTTRRSLGGVGSSSTSQSLAVIATVPPPFGFSRVYPQTRSFPLSRAGAQGSSRKPRSRSPVAKAHEHVSPNCGASNAADSGGILDRVRYEGKRDPDDPRDDWITSVVMSCSRPLDLCESLGEGARSLLVTEDAYTVDRALDTVFGSGGNFGL